MVKGCTVVVFLGGHFLFTSSDTFAVECIVQPQRSAKNRTAEISASGITTNADKVCANKCPSTEKKTKESQIQNYTKIAQFKSE